MEYEIKCEIVFAEINRHCGETAHMQEGNVYTIAATTPGPDWICAKAFDALFPIITDIFSEEMT